MTFLTVQTQEPNYFDFARSITPGQFGKVAVLYGGDGPERDVSLVSGKAVCDALCEKKVNAVLVDTQKDAIGQLQRGSFDRAFNVLHGPLGEDGTILGVLKYLNIPCTGSDLESSALAMDKVRSKLIWQALKMQTPSWGVAHSWSEAENIARSFAYPLVVKPVDQGSSVGVHVNLKDEESFEKAFEQTHQEFGKALIEPFIEGEDFFVAIVGCEVLPSVRVSTKEDFYSYKAKYLVNDNQYISPGGLASQEKELADISLKAYQALGCSGWGRLDFRLDRKGKFWLLEVNTVPGMTPHSLVPTAAKALGIDFDTLVFAILSKTLYPF
jgi:D-alanine-D-alanine ligase